MIIGISGKKQHGKDTVCKIIQYLIYFKMGGISFSKIIDYLNDKNLDLERLANYVGFYKKFFAEKLKLMVCLLLNCTMEQLEDNDFKEKELGEEWDVYYYAHYKWKTNYFPHGRISKLYGSYYEAGQDANEIEEKFGTDGVMLERKKLTPRLLLQLLGTEAGREIIHPNIWINALMSEYKPMDEKKVTSSEALALMKEGKEVMVLGYGGDEDSYTGITINDYEEWPDHDILETLDEYKKLEVWKGTTGWNGEDDTVFPLPNWIIADVRFPNEVKMIKDKGGVLVRVNRPEMANDMHYSEVALDGYDKFDFVLTNNSGVLELAVQVQEMLTRLKLL